MSTGAWRIVLTALVAFALIGLPVVRADEPSAAAAMTRPTATGEYSLADFGPVKTATEAQATLDAACRQLVGQGGGTLVIGPNVAPGWAVENTAPSSTKPGSPQVTVIDRRAGYESLLVPANGRAQLSRTVRQPIDMPFGVHSTRSIETNIAGGTTSYDQPSLEAVKAGDAQRVYVPTIRGLAPGLRLVLSGRPMGYGEPNDRIVIKSLGWDPDRRQHYLVAALKFDHPKGVLVYDKHVVNSLTVTDYSQSDNQSMGILALRKNYAPGDSFVISASAKSMSNIMSGAGDEGGLGYAADIYNDLQPFHSTVETYDAARLELVYAPGAVRNHTLGTGRPLINMNPDKWVRQGEVYYVGSGYRDPWEPDKTIVEGAVIGSKECGWTQDIVGRFFAFDEASEYLDPKQDGAAGYTGGPERRVHRWYQIHRLAEHKDGTQRIWLERVRWNVQYYVPLLYDSQWFSCKADGGKNRLKPMHYIIAPGGYVADVSRAWTDSESSNGQVAKTASRTLKLAPTGDTGTALDFAPGDPIDQAIGPDPWNVTGLRVRHHNCLPSTIEDSALQAVNNGRVAVDSALSIGGGSPELKACAEQMKTHGTAFRKGIDIGGTTGVGIRFGADVADAGIKFEQPNKRPQHLAWFWYTNQGWNPSSTFGVSPETGEFLFRGGPVRAPGVALSAQTGISGSDTAAHNLRGIAVAVAAGATECQVPFAVPEADARYALTVQPAWNSACAVVAKTAGTFTVRFEQPAPVGSTLDWLLVR